MVYFEEYVITYYLTLIIYVNELIQYYGTLIGSYRWRIDTCQFR